MDEDERNRAEAAPSDDPVRIVDHYVGHGAPIVGDDDPGAWLLRSSRSIERIAAAFDELCWRIVGSGVPLWRATLHTATLHPQLSGLGCRWWRDRGYTEEFTIAFGAEATRDFLGSPIRDAVLEGKPARYRLSRTHGRESPLLGRLWEAGATDYLALPLFRLTTRYPVVTFATDAPGGFSQDHVARLEQLVPPLAAVVEGRAVRRIASDLLETYLGRQAGLRVLAGQVRRGEGELLRAVIIASDLRGFTHMSDRLPSSDVVALLNHYFERIAGAVGANGGEVLKFIGDGVLSIIPVDGENERAAAEAALLASTEALAELESLNRAKRRAECMLRAGLGLHIGEVVYGNVGSATRLDFTVIGPAVNLAFRLEEMTKRLARPLLASAAFAHAAPGKLVSLGIHPVRGFGEPEEVFGLA